MDWSHGYITNIPYATNYYRETSPTLLAQVCRDAGRRPPPVDGAFTYCELGAGHGFNCTLSAATHPAGRFYSFDFNPGYVAHGAALAAEAGLTNIEFGEESFESLASGSRPDLPAFDFIVLHGIYSWVSPANRAHIVRFIGQKLKPGGVAYISYNCLPGWAATAPLRHLLVQHARLHPNRPDLQLDDALSFIAGLKDAGARYFQVSPSIEAMLTRLGGQNRNYLAHEYLNADWHPLYHADVMAELQPAKLAYVGSASPWDNLNRFSLPEEVVRKLGELTDTVMAETVKDYARNQQFRRDVLMRGSMALAPRDALAQRMAVPYVPVVPPAQLKSTFTTPIATIGGSDAVFKPLLGMFTEGPVTVKDLHRNPALSTIPEPSLLEAVQMLTAGSMIHPCGPAGDGAAARRLNRAVARRALAGDVVNFLAAPAAGTGFSADFYSLMAYTVLADRPDMPPGELGDAMWQIMLKGGQRPVVEGRTLRSEEEARPEVARLAGAIVSDHVPLWRRLGAL